VDKFYIEVAVIVPLKKNFLYLPLSDTNFDDYKIGARVYVPFGAKKNVVAIITNVIKSDANLIKYGISSSKLKYVTSIIDNQNILDIKLLQLASWISNYYYAPLGEVFALFLPKQLRIGKLLDSIDMSSNLYINVDLNLIKKSSITEKQLDLLTKLNACDDGLKEAFLLDLGYKKTSIDSLIQKGFIYKTKVKSNEYQNKIQIKNNHYNIELSDEQQKASDQIINSLSKFQVFLLFGITGSGKTEVYLTVVKSIFKNNNSQKQVLVLLPEIGLTPQIINRFEAIFDVPIMALHSKCTDTERARRWSYIKSGASCIVLGTRSAVFAPFVNLELIVVDEEHDLSFRQHDKFVRYCAKDVAIMRAKQCNIPIILGSATPSFESYHNTELKKYHKLELTKRPGSGVMPDIKIIDVKSEKLQTGLSNAAIKAIKQHLSCGYKVMLFLNRRGFAPILLCHDCGWIAKCINCDASLTLHMHSKRLVCHHCNYIAKLLETCPKCGSFDLNSVGIGTEQLENHLKQNLLKEFNLSSDNIIRIDKDTTSKKGSLELALNSINKSNNPQIILGTQMLAKGHNFNKLNLVVILDPDFSFFSSDFRASEKSMQLLMQVCGRSGRMQSGGQVLLQTHFPEHDLWKYVKKSDYKNFVCNSLTQRLKTNLPPISFMALLRVESNKFEDVMHFLSNAKNEGASLIKNYHYKNIINLLGPVPAPMARKNSLYRGHLLILSTKRQELHVFLDNLTYYFNSLKKYNIKWLLEIDPKDIY
tara:strand:+ start:721 stop:2997 length:2277 start_codon:yes stop_codon:yes gene_type:complete